MVMHGKSIRIPGPRGLRARRVLRRVAREPKPPGRTAHSTRARAARRRAPLRTADRPPGPDPGRTVEKDYPSCVYAL